MLVISGDFDFANAKELIRTYYAGWTPGELLGEDKIIASFPIEVKEADITILPIEKVFQ